MTVVVEIEGEVVNYGENLAVTFYSVPEKDANYLEMHVHDWKATFRIMNHKDKWTFEAPIKGVKLTYDNDTQLFQMDNLPDQVVLCPIATKDFSKVPMTVDNGKTILGKGVNSTVLY